MAAPLLKHIAPTSAHARRRAPGWLANTQTQGLSSAPSHRQAMVQDQWMEIYDAATPRWPVRRTIIIVALSCGGFWAGIVWGLAQIGH